MPRRSKVGQMPAAVRAWLDGALVANQFGEYEALSVILAAKGFAISKSSLHRYGSKLERRLAAIKASTEAANAIAAAAPDEADNRSNAIISLVQTEIFEALLAMQEAEECANPAARIMMLGKAAKNIASLTNASVTRLKWAAEVNSKIGEKLKKLEAQTGAKGGLDMATLKRVREEVYGIVS